MKPHYEIQSMKEAQKAFPRPWRVRMEDEDCWGIIAANGNRVVETDSGFYPPDRFTAEWIVTAVNNYEAV